MDTDSSLVTANDLDRGGIIRKGTAYRMAAQGKLPHYVVGCSGRSIRFRVDEVLHALRRPAKLDVCQTARVA
jgi:Helix-turn-helix domain